MNVNKAFFVAHGQIALFISCLGLPELPAYSFHTRTKEIGVRKVLGADEIEIVRLMGAMTAIFSMPPGKPHDVWGRTEAYPTNAVFGNRVLAALVYQL